MSIAPSRAIERRRLRVNGVVQGVGFRPFVHRLASERGIGGHVLNDGGDVLIEAEGEPEALESLAASLISEAPELARIERVVSETVEPLGARDFEIVASAAVAGAIPSVPPDIATCPDCLEELRDPSDRRHRYPFVNCTACGPRFTILLGLPYDRDRTTMAGFEMCAACRREYEDPADRRFHAEPIACPDCGPQLELHESGRRPTPAVAEPALARAVELLRDGAIVAVKGLGGYHLACDAGSDSAVARLRKRKLRDQKPFAVMTPDPDALAELAPAERALLASAARPIVLVRRRPGAPVAAGVAPGSPWLGVLRPYTPLHELLLGDLGRPLVMTSGNRSDEPIAIADADARGRLDGIADAFLGHDRPIRRRCEDSVVRVEFPIRRSRGLVPAGVRIPVAARRPVVATGAELKATFAVARERTAYLSPHLGDLSGAAAYDAFRSDLAMYLEMLDVEPETIACDLHPEYLSTRWAHAEQARRRASGRECELLEVQHHHAHAAACLADHGREAPALALVFDGTGYGTDGTIWGGELLRCDLRGFERLCHLEPVPLAGGEAAIREPWRVAAAYLERGGRPVPFEGWRRVREALKVNAPVSSGMGRLFDACAALLGVRERITYEGQAAIELESLAGELSAGPYPCRVEDGVITGSDLILAAHDDLAAGRPAAEIAAAFHEGVAAAAVRACELAGAPRTVVLSGGSFQNLRLLRSVRERLANVGFEVLTHERVPPNDGGVSLGQAAIAAART
jgi:hydrogenase maturation protein HypF